MTTADATLDAGIPAQVARPEDRSVRSVPVVLDLAARGRGVGGGRGAATATARAARAARRATNVVVAAAVLVLMSPLLVLVALAVKLDSAGPVLYRQERVGRCRIGPSGRHAGSGDVDPGEQLETFVLYKFRSMSVDAESETGAVWSSSNDQRVTRMGRWLRRLHLDELPQLWNVLVGDMNLVGPRPERPEFVKRFVRKVPLYSRRLLVRPGITGLAQIRQRSDRTLEDVRRKLGHDLEYLRKRSAKVDATIMLLTPHAVLRRTAGRAKARRLPRAA